MQSYHLPVLKLPKCWFQWVHIFFHINLITNKKFGRLFTKIWKKIKGKSTKKECESNGCISELTISQGREALLGSLFLCESALQATKPPKPVPIIIISTKTTSSHSQVETYWHEWRIRTELNTNRYDCCIRATTKHHLLSVLTKLENCFGWIHTKLQNTARKLK